MLHLNPPYFALNGLSCFSDHDDPMQWYYLPMGPRFATRTAADGREVPAFSLLRFRGDGGRLTGGLLSFDVDLGVPQEAIDEAAGEIRTRMHLPATPQLGPVPVEDGTVKLVLLGTETGSSGTFVEKIIQEARPALYGSHRAAFSAVLDAEGATLLQRTLDGELLPIGVVYQLDYLALRPAYAVRLSIDWERVQEHFDERFGAQGMFLLSGQIEEVLDELEDERLVVVEVDGFVPDDEAGKHIIDGRERAVAAVHEMITDAFFTVTLPEQPAPDGWDKAKELVTEYGSLVHSGWGLTPRFSYDRTNRQRVDRKRLDVRFNERTAVRRTIYPQGHLAGLAEQITASGLPIGSFTRDIDLDDAWFSRREVRVVSRVPFDFVDSITVALDYAGDQHHPVLDSTRPEQTVTWWAQRGADGRVLQPVDATATYHLRAPDGYTLPRTLVTKETVRGEVLALRADEAFRVLTVPVRADGIPWSRWSHVEAHVHYEDAANGLEERFTLDLTEAQPSWNVQLFVVDPGATTFSRRLVFHGRDRPDAVLDWADCADGELRVVDPYPAKLGLAVTPSVDWSQVERILVDLAYEDPGNALRVAASHELLRDSGASPTFVVDLADPALRRVRYDVTFLFADGRKRTVPSSTTCLPRLLLSEEMQPTQAVQVRVDTSDSRRTKLRDVTVEFAAAGSDEPTGALTFLPGSPSQFHEFTWDAAPAYRYRARYRFTNGLSRTTNWADSRSADLDLPGR